MISAFGVEHGEIEKAFGGSFKMPTLNQLKPQAAKRKGPSTGQKRVQQAREFGAGLKNGAQKRNVSMLSSAGQKGQQAGSYMRHNIKPIAGGTVLGGGAMGLTGGMYHNRKSQRLAQYR